MDPGWMDYRTSGAARWRNIRGDRDNGTDSDFISPSLLWRDVPHGHPHPGALSKRERGSDSGIDSEVIPESADTELQVVPLLVRLVSAVATGRLELIPFLRKCGFIVALLLCCFPPCGDGRYINI